MATIAKVQMVKIDFIVISGRTYCLENFTQMQNFNVQQRTVKLYVKTTTFMFM